MPPAYAPQRSRPGRPPYLVFGAVLGVLLVGVVGTLLATGAVVAASEFPYLSLSSVKQDAPPSHEGMIEVPMSAQPIAAYARVTRDDITDKQAKKIAVLHLYPHEIGKDTILDYAMVGRVLKYPKKPGYVFTEKDFYPPGTPAGVTAGVPAGKRAFVLAADKVSGIADLRQGDRFDILAAVELDARPGPAAVAPNLITGNPLVAGPGSTPAAARRALSIPVVQNGVVVVPATVRSVPVAGSPTPASGQPKTKTAQEVTIAVEPDEVGWVAEALATKATLTCVARSGHPSQAPPEGLVTVPVSGHPVAAYAKVGREHLLNPITRTVATISIRPDDLPDGTVRSVSQIVGRVLRHDKPAGYTFAEADFYPPGTPAGLTAGVPPGKRSFVFEAEKVQGMATLRQGVHFDIVSAVTVDDKFPTSPGTKLIPLGVTGTPGKRAAVRPVVQNGVVLVPATPRPLAAAGGQPKVVTEVTVAIDLTEVAALSETLAVHTSLTCVARSGQPSDQPDADVPGKPLDVRVTAVETIVGGKREVREFVVPVRSEAGGSGVAPAPRPAGPPKPGN